MNKVDELRMMLAEQIDKLEDIKRELAKTIEEEKKSKFSVWEINLEHRRSVIKVKLNAPEEMSRDDAIAYANEMNASLMGEQYHYAVLPSCLRVLPY